MIERITAATVDRDGHDLRYRLAAGHIDPGDRVLDAACGTGYGSAFSPHAHWTGVDIEDAVEPDHRRHGRWITADLDEWVPDESFDVAVSFETLEHVRDPGRLVDILCQAGRLVICSVPIVPTVGANPYHLHDFTMWDLPGWFSDRGWRLRQCLLQPAELAAIYLFSR